MHKYTKGKKMDLKSYLLTAVCELTYQINTEKILEEKRERQEKEQSPVEGSLCSDTFHTNFKKFGTVSSFS